MWAPASTPRSSGDRAFGSEPKGRWRDSSRGDHFYCAVECSFWMDNHSMIYLIKSKQSCVSVENYGRFDVSQSAEECAQCATSPTAEAPVLGTGQYRCKSDVAHQFHCLVA